MSSAMPMAVVAEANASVWAKMPGIRNSRYEPPPGSGIAPPNTKANSSTNMIDWMHREDRQLRDARHPLEVAPGHDQRRRATGAAAGWS